MQSVKFSLRSTKVRRIAKLIFAVIAGLTLFFFLMRFLPLREQDEDFEFLRLVNEDNSLPAHYSPELAEVEGVQVSLSCAEALSAMLSAAREEGCEPVLLEGYLDRKSLKSKADMDEHQLGLTVDIVDKSYQEKDLQLAQSDTYKWLEENCWEYGFVIRYPENKTDVTGGGFMPWHYRYVGLESAKLMFELGLCLEEYNTWFYSDEVIIVMD